MSFAAALRRDLADCARQYALAEALPHCLSYGEVPIVCFEPYRDNSRHGNFFPTSYKAICTNPAWRKRLAKIHTLGHRALPASDRGRWMELDSCTSSDALLMNIFCHPGALRNGKVCALLGVQPGLSPCFGYRARVPLANARFDRTEVDLLLGNLLVEAKLTEGDFQSAPKRVLLAYRDFADVSIGGSFRKPVIIIFPINFYATYSRPMLSGVHSAFWSTLADPICSKPGTP